jgi:hypothetical protein
MGKLQIAEVDFCQSYCYEITTSLLSKSISRLKGQQQLIKGFLRNCGVKDFF